MREIKFRAWFIYDKSYLYGDDYWLGYSIDTLDELFEDKDVVWEQYTGLKDKNGKEIYEGDIVSDGRRQSDHCLSGVHAVEYLDGAFMPFAVAAWEVVMDPDRCEIIGNIHENTELLS